jgi:hypothetical protein
MFLNKEEVLNLIIEEHLYVSSSFMDEIILFNNSMFKYYKNKYNKNLYFHFLDLFKYYDLRRYLRKHNVKKFINIYLNANLGWYKNDMIPVNKTDSKIEIVTKTGKHIKAQMSGYGFIDLHQNDSCTLGWLMWVKRWRFTNNNLNRDVELTVKKG